MTTDTTQELIRQYGDKLNDPMWRICSGALYKIIIKGEKEDDSLVIPFIPNEAQLRFMKRLHHRNIILKARQRGFTTLVAIMWLDHALFVANSRCGMIAQDKEAAEVIFRDKVKFAYENLPTLLLNAFPLARDSASELLFSHNNSSVRVATSLRSGTIHRLHVSEYGKICAKYPEKAKEVMTGSIPAVPLSGLTIIESTAEGTEGEFYELTERAMNLKKERKKLTERDWRFHFFAWWDASPDYEMSPEGVNITEKDHKYFDLIEAEMNTTLTDRQRAWYVATRDADYPGTPERMHQEYPSTPNEAFQQSTEGNYYREAMANVRKSKRILCIPELDVPVNTFWDIGNSDGCAIWFHQQVGMEDRFIGYYEAHGETLAHYAKELQRRGYLYNKHFMPHDADHQRLSDTNKSTKQMMMELGVHNIEIVPVISDLNLGIQMVRKHIATAYFDEVGCKDGINRLDNYKKRYSTRDSRWLDEPNKANGCSEGADALRQWAQVKEAGKLTMAGNTQQRRQRSAPDWRL
jgi:hypothetical protein